MTLTDHPVLSFKRADARMARVDALKGHRGRGWAGRVTLRRAMVVVGLLAAVWSAAAAPARATFGAQTTADEPQYLLTALSLWEDGSLDIADELAAERWRDFHRANLPEQTEPRPDGRRLSPHDPLLPVLLAIPMGLGGWLGAKLALAAVAGGLAALLVWVAVRRFAVAPATAAVVVGAFAIVPPFAAYGTQVYPELPAALAVTLAIAAVTGPLGRGGRWLLGAAVIALPWLAVKYVPVAAVLVAIALIKLWRRGDRRPAVALAGGLALGGAAYLGFHRAVYGGWTVYASGDHFTSGELTVVGHQPNYAGRSTRLLGLMNDRYFGLAAWAPSWLLAIPALAAIARRRPTGWPALLAPAAVGWLIATFVALTMHGFWWPGRQVVVVLPAVVLAVAWWLPIRRVPAIALVAGTAMAVISWVWLLVEVLGERLNLVTAFGATTNPLFRAWHVLLPDYRNLGPTTWGLHGLWLAAALALAAYGWRTINHQGENHR